MLDLSLEQSIGITFVMGSNLVSESSSTSITGQIKKSVFQMIILKPAQFLDQLLTINKKLGKI